MDTGATSNGAPTLLKALLRARHWQKHSTFVREWDKIAKAIDPQLVGTWPRHAQFYRWLRGELRELPYPDACRVLEAMFPQYHAKDLFQPCPPEISRSTQRSSSGFRDSSSPGASPAKFSPTESLLAPIPHNFSADVLGGFWVTCFEYDSTCHADICQIIPECDRWMTIRNYPPDPRVEGRASSFRNKIKAELVNRHVIGHWKNVNDTYYFGSIHLAVLPGKTVMEGFYTCFLNDVQVVTARWKWVRLDSASLSGVELSQVVLREPRLVYTLVDQHSQHDMPLTLTAVTEGI